MSDRRSLRRRLSDLSRWGLSWLEEKQDGHRRLSGFRLILAAFAGAYVTHWPTEWSGPVVALAAVIIFGLPVRDLFRAVPASEALGALEAFFGNVMGKAGAAVDSGVGYVARTSTVAGFVPHEWADGDPQEGLL